MFDIPRWQRWALEASKPRIEAQETLAQALMQGIEYTPQSWFDQTMYATGGTPIDIDKGEWEGGDRDLAEKRMHMAIERKMNREIKSEGR